MTGRGRRLFAAGPAWYLWLVLVVMAVAGPAIALQRSASNLRQSQEANAASLRQSQQAWCGLFSVLSDGYTEPAPGAPPLSVRGQRIAEKIDEIRNTYQCP